MKYRRTDRKTMVEQFQQVRDNPKVSATSDININSNLFTTFKQNSYWNYNSLTIGNQLFMK